MLIGRVARVGTVQWIPMSLEIKDSKRADVAQGVNVERELSEKVDDFAAAPRKGHTENVRGR